MHGRYRSEVKVIERGRPRLDMSDPTRVAQLRAVQAQPRIVPARPWRDGAADLAVWLGMVIWALGVLGWLAGAW